MISNFGSAFLARLPNLNHSLMSDRTNQRYEGNARLVCGCVLIRRAPHLQFLLVKANKRDDWIFPKGGWEHGESAEAAALREAYEEAGVRGRVLDSLGVNDFTSPKGKASRLHSFLVEVDELLNEYPECVERDRKWVCTISFSTFFFSLSLLSVELLQLCSFRWKKRKSRLFATK
jgi:diphosphoinositol-polyphosphate diphosphatase